MNLASWGVLGGAVGAATVAVLAGNNLQISVPVGAVAVLLISLVGAIQLRSSASKFTSARTGVIRQAPRPRVESDSLLRLRRAFRAGEIGRASIVATIRSLERDLIPTDRTVLSLDSERALLDLPPEGFRQWVDDRLRRIEAVT